MSEMEYLNILPDITELDDSSFMKNSFVIEKAMHPLNRQGDVSKFMGDSH